LWKNKFDETAMATAQIWSLHSNGQNRRRKLIKPKKSWENAGNGERKTGECLPDKVIYFLIFNKIIIFFIGNLKLLN